VTKPQIEQQIYRQIRMWRGLKIGNFSNLVSEIPNMYYIKYIYKKRFKWYLDDFNQRTDKIMPSPQKKYINKWKKAKGTQAQGQTMIYNTLHRKAKVDHHRSHWKPWVHSCVPEGLTVIAPFMGKHSPCHTNII
jgi:hypothetical protein